MPVVAFCMFFTSDEINTKQSPNGVKLFGDFFGPEDIKWVEEAPGGAPRGAQPTRARLGPQAPGWVGLPSGPRLVLLWPNKCLLV